MFSLSKRISTNPVLNISGGIPLRGEIACSGAKNSALGILASSILSSGELRIENVPHLRDITTMVDLLVSMGASVTLGDNMQLCVDASDLSTLEAPYHQVSKMRASIMVLGPLLARYGKARVPLPGGCAIGPRPVDIHLSALASMGADIAVENGYVVAEAKKLVGTEIQLELPTMTGTENIMMAATLAQGTTRIGNAAKEPEVVDLANCLNAMGADVRGAGSDTIEIHGVRQLDSAGHQVMSDRIECGTFLAAAAATRGHIKITAVEPNNLMAVLTRFREAGAEVEVGQDWVSLDARNADLAGVSVRTAPYPSFPTDMQAQFMAVNASAKGTSVVTETVFESRFLHVQELNRLGANILLRGNTAIVEGVPKLTGARIKANDLRASAGLIIGGLAAQGETLVEDVMHIDRGYECIEEKLQLLGAEISRSVL